MTGLSDLTQLDRWLNLSAGEQDAVIRDLEQWLGGEYVHKDTLNYSDKPSFRIPTFEHLPTGLEFNLIVGGQFNMGLSDREEETLRSLIEYLDQEGSLAICAEDVLPSFELMRPVHAVRMRPFLMSRLPILNSFAREHVELNPVALIYGFGTNSCDRTPALLTREQINVLLEKWGFQLPSEAQWEYAYRAGTTTLFYWGDELEDEDEDKIALLEFSDPEECRQAANPFGLVGMGVGEWCQDSYRPDYREARGDDLPVVGGAPYVVRGGAAMSSPWQGVGEFITCICAMRESEYEHIFAGRFVKVIDLKVE